MDHRHLLARESLHRQVLRCCDAQWRSVMLDVCQRTLWPRDPRVFFYFHCCRVVLFCPPEFMDDLGGKTGEERVVERRVSTASNSSAPSLPKRLGRRFPPGGKAQMLLPCKDV